MPEPTDVYLKKHNLNKIKICFEISMKEIANLSQLSISKGMNPEN